MQKISNKSHIILDQDIIGLWKLRSFKIVDSNQNVSYPMTSEAKGQLIYMNNNHINVILSTPNRPNFASDNILEGTIEEQVKAFQTFLAYSGTYTLKDNIIYHHIQLSSYPNYVGMTLERFVTLDNDTLILTTPEMLIGANNEVISTLTWEK